MEGQERSGKVREVVTSSKKEGQGRSRKVKEGQRRSRKGVACPKMACPRVEGQERPKEKTGLEGGIDAHALVHVRMRMHMHEHEHEHEHVHMHALCT